MSKLNPKTASTKTVNRAGGAAYQIDVKEQLALAVLTSLLFEPKFYGDNTSIVINNIRNAIKSGEAQFVANLAVYAREELGLRSISHAIAAELAHAPEGKSYARQVIDRICRRPDDMTEILAYYLNVFGKPIPNSLKKGLGDVLKRFDEYQLAKYKSTNKNLKLRDILRICHPKPDSLEQSDLWGRLIRNQLATPYTWETEVTAKGNKKEVWEELIASKRLPYIAGLRNLYNIWSKGADNLPELLKFLSDPKQIARNGVTPYAIYNSYKALRYTKADPEILSGIAKILHESVNNLPRLPGKTVILTDVSGSMFAPLSAKGHMSYAEVGLLLSAVANRICDDSTILFFDTDVYLKDVPKSRSIPALIDAFLEEHWGGGTHAHKAFEYLLEHRIYADRILLFSDMQCYADGPYSLQTFLDKYRREINPDVYLHSIDLAGYGTSQFSKHDTRVHVMAGWSEKILKFIPVFEAGAGSMVEQIENYKKSER